MKVRVPKGVELPEVKKGDDGRVRQRRRYRLITPLFGGGVESNQADPITVVRGTEVRGQLRFWWRATQGGRFDGDLEEMREAEEVVWGGVASKNPVPSNVTVSVEVLNRGKPFKAKDNKGRPVRNIGATNSLYSYVAFPLREEGNPVVLEGVEFELTICYSSELKKEVNAALWAWETFGGLGARTRRGFGALQLLSVDGQAEEPPPKDQVQAWVSNGLKEHVSSGPWHKDVTHLARDSTFTLVYSNASPIKVWHCLIEQLKKFRASRWPEADALRRLMNTHAPKHAPRHPIDKFPRGQFGLPIIFHFRDQDSKRGDPPESRLEGTTSNRFASSLILRPVACADGAIGLVLRLESPESPPGGYVIRSGEQVYSVKVQDLSQSEASQIEPLDGEIDVLQAFFNFLRTG